MHVARTAPRAGGTLPLQYTLHPAPDVTRSIATAASQLDSPPHAITPPATPAVAAPGLPHAYARLRRREQAMPAPRCEDEGIADGVDALALHDAQVELAMDYEALAHQALARGAWTVAVRALERWRALDPPRSTGREEWRMAMATARMAQGSPQEALALLRQTSPHASDVRAAWSAMGRDFERWGMTELAQAAHARGCCVSRHDVGRALEDREAAEAFLENPDLRPEQRAAYENLLKVFEA